MQTNFFWNELAVCLPQNYWHHFYNDKYYIFSLLTNNVNRIFQLLTLLYFGSGILWIYIRRQVSHTYFLNKCSNYKTYLLRLIYNRWWMNQNLKNLLMLHFILYWIVIGYFFLQIYMILIHLSNFDDKIPPCHTVLFWLHFIW